MSALAVAAVVAAAAWLGLLTIVVMLVVRQVGLVTVRLDRAREAEAPVLDGLDVGAPAPDEVLELLPRSEPSAPLYAILLAGACSPCRDLVTELGDTELPHPAVALVGGRDDAANAMTELLPVTMPRHAGEVALAAIDALQTRTTPSVYEVTSGVITGKAALRGADHLIAFMRDTAGAGQFAITKVGGR